MRAITSPLVNAVRRGVVGGSPTDPLEELIAALFGNGEQGAFYLPQPVVNGNQVLFQDAAGTIPVTADGDPVGLMKDLSGNSVDALQSTPLEKPLYPGLKYSGDGQKMETGLEVDAESFGGGFLWCFWARWDSIATNTGSNGGVYNNPRLYVQQSGGGELRVAVGDNFNEIVSGITAGEWVHISVSYDGSVVTAYKDAQPVGTMTASFAGSSVERFELGTGFNGEREMNGAIGSTFLSSGLKDNPMRLIAKHFEIGPSV